MVRSSVLAGLALAFSGTAVGQQGNSCKVDAQLQPELCRDVTASIQQNIEEPTELTSKRRSLSEVAIVESGCNYALENGWNNYLNGGCCNAANCCNEGTCTRIPSCNQSYHTCFQNFKMDYFGEDQHYKICQCGCVPGQYSDAERKEECCSVWSRTCDSLEICEVNSNYVAYCKDAWIRVALIERLTARTGPALSEEWKAVLAAAALAVKHFNERNSKYTPALEEIQDCKLQIKVTSIIDTESDPLRAVPSIVNTLQGKSLFLVGPPQDDIAQATSFVAQSFNIPMVSYNFGSHVSSGSSLQSNTFIQAAVASEEIALAMCKYVRDVLKHSSVIVLEQRDDRKAMSLITNLKVACQRVGVDVSLFTLPEEKDRTQENLEKVLIAANATGMNGIIFPLHEKLHLMDQALHSAFDVGLLRDNTVWIFSNEDMTSSFDSYSIDMRQVLHGSTLIQAGGASLTEDTLFHHLVGSWSSISAQDVVAHLPSSFSTYFTDEFFQTFDAYSSEKLRTFGALQYDMITALGLLTCILESSESVIYPRTTVRQKLLENLGGLDFEGLTGRVKFDTETNTRDKAHARVFVSNLVTTEEALEPTRQPTASPTQSPTSFPTKIPTESPTFGSPSASPTRVPTEMPTFGSPTVSPTNVPTRSPSAVPSQSPSMSPITPTANPTNSPSTSPTNSPSTSPTVNPTNSPSTSPTVNPTNSPSTSPTVNPTSSPTQNPTSSPSVSPTLTPTNSPTTSIPTGSPTTPAPSKTPTTSPTQSPTSRPTRSPTPQPTELVARKGFRISHVARFDLVSETFTYLDSSGTASGQIFNGGVGRVPPNFVERPADLLRVGILHPLVTEGEIVKPSKCYGEPDGVSQEDSTEVQRCYSQGEYLSAIAGILLGIEHFNARNATFVPGLDTLKCNKKITFQLANTGGSEDQTLNEAIALLDKDPVDMILGPFNFSTITTAAALASVYRTPFVSYTSSSSALNDGGKLARLNVAQLDVVKAVCLFWGGMNRFQVAAVFVPTSTYGDALRRDLRNACRPYDVELTFISYSLEGSLEEEVEKSAQALLEAKRNIVLVAGQEHSYKKEGYFFTNLLDRAHELGLLGEGTSWSFLDWYAPRYMKSCNNSTQASLNGSLYFGVSQTLGSTEFQTALEESLASIADKIPHHSETSRGNFEEVIELHRNQTPSALEIGGRRSLAALAYDAAILTGQITCTISPQDAVKVEEFERQFLANMPTTTFQGASGLVGFQSTGLRRKESIDIIVSNWEFSSEQGFQVRPVYSVDPVSGILIARKVEGNEGQNVKVLFNNGTDKVPADVPSRPPYLLRVGLLQRITDHSVVNAQACTAYVGGRWEGSACYQDDGWRAAFAAGLLAVAHFNQRNPVFVKEFATETSGCNKMISLSVQDSGAERGMVLDAMQAFSRQGVDIVVGPYDDDLTTSAALLGSIYKLPQVCHGATSAGLNNKNKYPYFSRVVPSDAASALALCYDWNALGYKQANVLYIDNGYGRSFAASILAQCAPLEIELLLVPFKVAPLKLDTTSLVRSKVNVLVLVAKAEPEVQTVLSTLYDVGLMGAGKQLYFSSEATMGFLHAANLEIRQAVNGSRLVLPVGGNEENPVFASFVKNWEKQSVGHLARYAPSGFFSVDDSFFQQFDKSRYDRRLAQVVAYHYDAVALAALAACAAAPQERIDEDLFSQNFVSQLPSVKFSGLTGEVRFDSSGDRDASTSVFELFNIILENLDNKKVEAASSGQEQELEPRQEGGRNLGEGTAVELRLIGTFLPATRQFVYDCTKCSPAVFNGGLESPPKNVEDIVVDMNSVDAVKRLCRAMGWINILICWFSCVWIVKYRNHKVVKASQKNFLFLFIFGKILSSISIMTLTMDDLEVGLEGASSACMSTLWLYSTGFFLSFATLFEKNKRAYNIFSVTYKVTDNRFSDKVLLKKILLYLVVDVIILLIYTWVSPEQFVRETVLRDENGRETASAGYCTSNYMGVFYGILGLYHTGILVYGSYISYLAKGINSAFSEAKYISTTLFSMLQVWALAIPLAVVVSNNPVSFMFVRSGVTFLADIVSLSLIVGSKLVFVHVSVAKGGIGASLVGQKRQPKPIPQANKYKVHDQSTLISGTDLSSIPTAAILDND